MTQLVIFSGQRLARPIGVDWFRQLKPAKLLNLKPGNLVWYIDDGAIICAKVTRASKRLDELGQLGIQVFCSSRTKIWYPCLIRDKQPSIFYMITDREAAYEYYAHAEKNVVGDTKLRLVGTG